MGLVLDAGIEEELRIRHLQVADATRASLGLTVHEYIVTETPLEVMMFLNIFGLTMASLVVLPLWTTNG